jgi:hypothetical protein
MSSPSRNAFFARLIIQTWVTLTNRESSVEVVISATGDEGISDLASLREWLDLAGDEASWKLTPEPPPSGDTLGFGVDEICAIVAVVEGLLPLFDRIKEWFGTRQEPKPIKLTITIDPANDDSAAQIGDGT